MPQYITRFVRSKSHKRKWYIHQVVDGDESFADDDPQYRWKFYGKKSPERAIRRLTRFKLNAEIKSEKIEDEYYNMYYNISLRFKSDSDEAEFIIRALSDQITLTQTK